MELARRVQSVSPSLTLSITAKAKQMKSQGINVISFGAGEPDFDTPQFIKEAAIVSLRKGFTKYTPVSGTVELRKAISSKLKRENGLEYSPDQIVVSCGAKHSLYNVFQVLLNEGDEVLIPSPYWLSYPEMVTLSSGRPVFLETRPQDGFLVQPRQLEKAVTRRTKAFILNSPSNPTGAVYLKEHLAAVWEIAKKHSFTIVSDEIYEKLLFDGIQHVSFASLSPEAKKRTVLVNGFSKAYSMTGWRLGYLAAEKEIAEAVDTLQSHSTSNPTSFAQVAAQAALEGPQEEVEQMRRVFERRRSLICDCLDPISKLTYFRPQGAFYIFCGIQKTGFKSLQLAERLLEEAQVAVVPGVVFGDDQAIRLSFAMADEDIREGIKRIGQWLAKRS